MWKKSTQVTASEAQNALAMIFSADSCPEFLQLPEN
jgi:hypothetical protein